MRKAFVVIGLGFGDEGKGATVDWLCAKYGAKLVVKYCGGPQCAHNVVLPDGTHHTFAQFGSGYFSGAFTYVDSNVIVNPFAILDEASVLRGKHVGKHVGDPLQRIAVNASCLVATPYHILMNHARELSRVGGTHGMHGTCGMGVGETRSYWLKHGLDAIQMSDLWDVGKLSRKLQLLKSRLCAELESFGAASYIDSLRAYSPRFVADSLHNAAYRIRLTTFKEAVAVAGVGVDAGQDAAVVYEGAQGMLLDEQHGFAPHTTWSNVTSEHAFETLDASEYDAVTVLGVVRGYMTRHGCGPMPTEGGAYNGDAYNGDAYNGDAYNGDAYNGDEHNVRNRWQGSMRYGAFDLPLFKYAAANVGISLDGVVVNCLDQLPEKFKVCTSYSTPSAWSGSKYPLEAVRPVYADYRVDGLLSEIGKVAPIYMTGHGPARSDRVELITADMS